MIQNGKNDTTDTLVKNRKAMDRFLEKFRDSGNIRLACRAADISRKTAYRWRNKWVTFASEWDEAKEDACDILEGEAWKRAVKDQSDRLLMFLLKAHRREVYGNKVSMEHTGKDDQPIKIAPTDPTGEHAYQAITDAERLAALNAFYEQLSEEVVERPDSGEH